MRIERRFTEPGKSPYDAIPFRESASEIRNPDGSVVIHLESFTVPEHWSQVAADILAQKYFRKAGVPAAGKKVEYVVYPGEGHGYNKAENVYDFYRRLEKFFGENLK